jgi:mono/diheme cytochrome c family protein
MATIAFIGFWIIVALGLFFVAVSGGPGGARERLHGQSRGGQRFAYAAFAVVVLVFGIALPAAATLGVNNKDSIPEASVSNLTEKEQRGRALFSEHCRLCHTLKAANSVASVGPNLDQLRPSKALVLNAIEQGRAKGNGAMARDLVVGEDAEAVASFVCKAVGSPCK